MSEWNLSRGKAEKEIVTYTRYCNNSEGFLDGELPRKIGEHDVEWHIQDTIRDKDGKGIGKKYFGTIKSDRTGRE